MSEVSAPSPPAKPGTACLGCRRRKLKCSREPDGCSNCLRSDLPCVYPIPEATGVKRKRGPYKKDKAPLERHLEDLVKYLEPKTSQSENAATDSVSTADQNGDKADSTLTLSDSTAGILNGARSLGESHRKTNAEELVKDALNALTRPAANDEPVVEKRSAGLQRRRPATDMSAGSGSHPPIPQVFELWHLFVNRVDPLIKAVHCPTFAKTLISAIDDLTSLGPANEALLFSIYYAAITTCTPREANKRFGEGRDVLLERYGRRIEASLTDNYGMPEPESLQALIVYMMAIRREDNTSSIRALFSLGVRMAQLMGLEEEPSASYTPYEAESRRRLWWQLCALESRGAEEGGSRSNSIMEDRHVALPANLFDFDLDPAMTETPKPRHGCTDMTFLLTRLDTIRVIHQLWKARKEYASKSHEMDIHDLKLEQRKILEEFKHKIETSYLSYLDESRPYDWLSMNFAKCMLIKARLIIDHPFGQVPTKQMTASQRLDLLQSSVDIIALTHASEGRKGCEPWVWYFRGWTQWHSLGIVISALAWSTSRDFVEGAWRILDPILAKWDKVYNMKRDEPAWDHVNALIERARQMRRKHFPKEDITFETATSMPLQQVAPAGSVTSTGIPFNGVPGLIPSESAASNIGTPEQYQPTSFNPPPLSNLLTPSVPFQTGCAPTLAGLEGDFGFLDDLQNVDFSAFDAVFGDSSWEFPASDSSDWSMGGLGL